MHCCSKAPSTLHRRNLKTEVSFWKCIKCFQPNNHRPFRICVWRKLRQGNHVIIVTSFFWTAPFSKRFPSTGKWKAGIFKFLRFKERVGKHPFSWRIIVDDRPNRRNKAVFSKRFLSTGKWKAGIFKFLRFKERVGKHAFSWQICVDG